MNKKETRIRLESQIITSIFNDNQNTVHFDYHVDIDDDAHNIRLDLYTHNARNHQVFLLHQTKGSNSIEALEKMIAYLKQTHHSENKNSYTVHWVDKRAGDGKKHASYFFETSEAEVLRKFFYNKREMDFEVTIEQNPIT